jgi:hypothetical protein
MNSNFWININIDIQEGRENFATRTSLRHFQGIFRFFIDDVVILSDNNFVNALIDQSASG